MPDRRVLLERVAGAVLCAGRGEPAGVCVVDLDGSTGADDRDGHAAGDAVLRRVAAAVRETDTVARTGGDVFAVLAACPAPADHAALAGRLRAAVAEVGAGCGVTAGVGCALLHPDDDVAGVLHRADAPMYRAEAAGGDRAHDLAR